MKERNLEEGLMKENKMEGMINKGEQDGRKFNEEEEVERNVY